MNNSPMKIAEKNIEGFVSIFQPCEFGMDNREKTIFYLINVIIANIPFS